ncbi:ABC transporter ATP-binding protein [Acidipropionibacterium jensenii]|uniref:ABC transporter ATP-binding protein n=1 Tax=Acidipropionibacterium jensenii TaxID=1749 RepID=UPI001F21E526|nr:ABC transporter ATP-binding protein [Acidipropionibacterium jensenii]
MRPAIEAEGVSKIYRSRDGESGLRELSLHANEGEALALLGPNGAGKTTAIRGLATLVAFDRGTARVGGYDVSTEAARVREHIGLVGQYAAVDEQLTAGQNLRFFGRLRGLARRFAGQRADELIEGFGLGEAQNRAVSTFSGGMRRRLDLATSLVVPPQVLFVDEPTSGLDPAARRDLWESLRALVRGGTTMLLTTQYLEEADHLADRIVLLARGTVVAQGTPNELKTLVGPPCRPGGPRHHRRRAELLAGSQRELRAGPPGRAHHHGHPAGRIGDGSGPDRRRSVIGRDHTGRSDTAQAIAR